MDDVKTLRIESLAQGGEGVAKEPGRPVVFIPRGAPGDLVRARLDPASPGQRFARATLLDVLEPGPGRRAPPCPETEACGGCQWQHLDDDAQDEAIRALLVEALRRIARIDDPERVVAPAAGLPARLAYRQRVRLHLSGASGSRAPALGFFEPRSARVHPVARCPVALPELQDVCEALFQRAGNLAAALRGAEAEIQLDLPRDGAALARLETRAALSGDDLRRALGVIEAAAPGLAAAEAIGPAGRGGPRARAHLGLERVEYRRGPLEAPERFVAFASPGGFLQASRTGNALLVSRVIAAARQAGLPAGARVLELFAGDGNFSLPLAAEGWAVTASDVDERALSCFSLAAARHAGELAFPLQVEAAAAHQHARGLADAGATFDLVVMDPPRAGAREACAELPRLAPRAIVMVSCDAATLARDVGLLAREGYALQRAEPLGLFPQTAHFETVALLTR